LEPARNTIYRLRKRDLFAFAGEIILTPEILKKLNEKQTLSSNTNLASVVKSEIMEINERVINNNDGKIITQDEEEKKVISSDDIFCVTVKIGYGKGKKNPVSDTTSFYRPSKPSPLSNESETPLRVGVLPPGFISTCLIY
jgi:hypothetical protein